MLKKSQINEQSDNYLNLVFPQWLQTSNQQNKSHYSKGCTNEPISSGIYEEACGTCGWHIDLTTYDTNT